MAKKMDPGLRETIRRELAWLADFIYDNSKVKDYRKVNQTLHELLDVSV